MRHKAIGNEFSLVLLVTKVLVYYYRSSWNIFGFCTMSLKTKNSWDIRLLTVACNIIKKKDSITR